MARIAKVIAIIVASVFLLGFVVLAIGSLVTVPMVSAKDDLKYAQKIGTAYRLKEDFKALGITDDLNEKQLHHYTILPDSSVGFSGPEIICRGILHEGLSLMLSDVLVSEWETILPRTIYVFSPTKETAICGGSPVYIDDDWFKEDHLEMQ